jgi:hypothetical protein
LCSRGLKLRFHFIDAQTGGFRPFAHYFFWVARDTFESEGESPVACFAHCPGG